MDFEDVTYDPAVLALQGGAGCGDDGGDGSGAGAGAGDRSPAVGGLR